MKVSWKIYNKHKVFQAKGWSYLLLCVNSGKSLKRIPPKKVQIDEAINFICILKKLDILVLDIIFSGGKSLYVNLSQLLWFCNKWEKNSRTVYT